MGRKRKKGDIGRKVTKRLAAMGGGITTSGVEFIAYKFKVNFLKQPFISGAITGVLGAGIGFVSKEGSLLESYGDGMIGASSARLAETALWKFGAMNGYVVNGGTRTTIETLGAMSDYDNDSMNGMEFSESKIDGWFENNSNYSSEDDDQM